MRTIHKVSAFRFLSRSRQIYKDPLPFHRENFQRYGNTFKISPKPGLMIHFTCDTELTQHILQKNQRNFHKSSLQTDDLGKYIGHGLLTANGEEWRNNRKLVQPAFYKKQLATLVDSMEQVIQKELSRIQPVVVTDIHDIFSDLAFKVVARSLFYLEDMDERINRLQHITEQAQKMLIKELRLPFLQWYYDRRWLSGDSSIAYHLELIDEARAILQDIIDHRRADTKEYGDLLDMLLQSTYEDGSHMSDRQLIDEILVLFIAGHETTANVLTFAAQLLAQHPDKAKAVQQEIANLSSQDLMEQLKELEYTKQVLEETMRLYPPAYVTDRVAVAEDSCGDIEIPKGSIWLISFFEMHRRKDLWERPDDFLPERFEPELRKSYTDHYFPFGAGPRMCIGNNFAMFEMALVLKNILANYDIQPVGNSIEYHPLITLRPKNARVIFTARK
ncbi:cytochrome P450 [Nonlabens marinus]|uniref:Cytochrome P450 hydroxylase n=1 Tax=Nonlabens marinus S1-08 TaxID=1454201 RepID=W8VWX3_9FLAO|nr:cytochrome P450 [Nonlabens marinus]BAO55137.1 cytochrome P450 hydroxylase [Nonlabens marinus S1-08]